MEHNREDILSDDDCHEKKTSKSALKMKPFFGAEDVDPTQGFSSTQKISNIQVKYLT